MNLSLTSIQFLDNFTDIIVDEKYTTFTGITLKLNSC